MSPSQPKRRRTSQGEKTRQVILRVAMDVASVEGLEGLSIGRLAQELDMSKSGIFAHFGSKEDLQLATIDTARSLVRREVFRPALASGKGLKRLWAFCEAWLAYTESDLFRGGCFFAATSVEFNSRPGAIRDRLAEIMKERLHTLELLIIEAQKLGEVRPEIDPSQLAFEIEALAMGANWAFQLYDNGQVIRQTRIAILRRLWDMANHTSPPLPPLSSLS